MITKTAQSVRDCRRARRRHRRHCLCVSDADRISAQPRRRRRARRRLRPARLQAPRSDVYRRPRSHLRRAAARGRRLSPRRGCGTDCVNLNLSLRGRGGPRGRRRSQRQRAARLQCPRTSQRRLCGDARTGELPHAPLQCRRRGARPQHAVTRRLALPLKAAAPPIRCARFHGRGSRSLPGAARVRWNEALLTRRSYEGANFRHECRLRLETSRPGVGHAFKHDELHVRPQPLQLLHVPQDAIERANNSERGHLYRLHLRRCHHLVTVAADGCGDGILVEISVGTTLLFALAIDLFVRLRVRRRPSGRSDCG